MAKPRRSPDFRKMGSLGWRDFGARDFRRSLYTSTGAVRQMLEEKHPEFYSEKQEGNVPIYVIRRLAKQVAMAKNGTTTEDVKTLRETSWLEVCEMLNIPIAYSWVQDLGNPGIDATVPPEIRDQLVGKLLTAAMPIKFKNKKFIVVHFDYGRDHRVKLNRRIPKRAHMNIHVVDAYQINVDPNA